MEFVWGGQKERIPLMLLCYTEMISDHSLKRTAIFSSHFCYGRKLWSHKQPWKDNVGLRHIKLFINTYLSTLQLKRDTLYPVNPLYSFLAVKGKAGLTAPHPSQDKKQAENGLKFSKSISYVLKFVLEYFSPLSLMIL